MCTTSGRKKSWVILTIGSSRFITVSVLAGESAVKARLQTSFHTRTTASFTTWSSTNNAHFSILEDVMLLLPCAAVVFFEKKLQSPLHRYLKVRWKFTCSQMRSWFDLPSGLKFMILSSTDLRVPSEEKAISGLPSPWATVTFRKYLEKEKACRGREKNKLQCCWLTCETSLLKSIAFLEIQPDHAHCHKTDWAPANPGYFGDSQ